MLHVSKSLVVNINLGPVLVIPHPVVLGEFRLSWSCIRIDNRWELSRAPMFVSIWSRIRLRVNRRDHRLGLLVGWDWRLKLWNFIIIIALVSIVYTFCMYSSLYHAALRTFEVSYDSCSWRSTCNCCVLRRRFFASNKDTHRSWWSIDLHRTIQFSPLDTRMDPLPVYVDQFLSVHQLPQ